MEDTSEEEAVDTSEVNEAEEKDEIIDNVIKEMKDFGDIE
jgi:hypothetical protein